MNKLIFSVAIVVSLTALTARADAIVNGSFEAPDVPVGTYQVFQSIPGWDKTVGHSIEIQDHIAGSPFLGNQFVELDSFANTGMVQQIPTTAGQAYQLNFHYSPRPNVGTASNGIEVYFDNVLLDTIAEDGVGLLDTSWSLKQYNVVASGNVSPLEFRAVGTSDSLGGYLDDVQFVAASVPDTSSTLVLLGAGLMGLFAMRRKTVR